MSRWRTHNKRAKAERKKAAYEAAFRYHMRRVRRLGRIGRLDKLKTSGFVRRQKAARK